METLTHYAIRTFVGLFMGLLFGFAGLVIGRTALPLSIADEELPRMAFISIGAGLGAALAWFRPGREARTLTFLLPILAVAAAFGAASIGFNYVRTRPLTGNAWDHWQHVLRTVVISAAVGANLLLIITGGLTAWMRRDS